MSNENNQNHCVNVHTSATVQQCMGVGVDGTPTTNGDGRILKVPVTLGNFKITTHLVADIHFPHPVLEIKDIKKRVVIVQCRLMTPSVGYDNGGSSTGPFPLFIKGYVRKNIQYASPCHNEEGECISSEMKSLTTNIPFECMATVDLSNAALLPVRNSRSEFDFFRAQDLGAGFPEKDQYLSSDLSQFHQQSTQHYNDLPFCELISSEIIEWDEATDRRFLGDGPEDEGYFQHVVEKMMLSFTVRVLQSQQVRIDLA
ncbi:CsxC family protein [Halobacillus yeomjeoni]|uniref:DUF3794 domain-containing protein n=1 Tax=Halobacillus yeomjeoni TaxID=311194 RepID=A0A931HY02_9BACI|nr:DUF3794 domain-containing protein [Halobacillus yeomjeoni]MBH0231490.1 DUF3794 domain-containing protein [Halobacillus yeomjeoni]